MLHTILVHEPSLLASVVASFDAKKIPSEDARFEVYKNANIFVIGAYQSEDLRLVLQSTLEQFIPDTVFFLTGARAVSDEKRVGDIVLPNVFFEYNEALNEHELDEANRDTFLKKVLFIEHYDNQNDYDFETFGLSVGGIGVSGSGEMDEDMRINLRLAYEADTFDRDTFTLVEEAQKLEIGEKIYPIDIVTSPEGSGLTADNALHIVRFFISSIEGEEAEIQDVPDEPEEVEEIDDFESEEDFK